MDSCKQMYIVSLKNDRTNKEIITECMVTMMEDFN